MLKDKILPNWPLFLFSNMCFPRSLKTNGILLAAIFSLTINSGRLSAHSLAAKWSLKSSESVFTLNMKLLNQKHIE